MRNRGEGPEAAIGAIGAAAAPLPSDNALEKMQSTVSCPAAAAGCRRWPARKREMTSAGSAPGGRGGARTDAAAAVDGDPARRHDKFWV